MRFSRNFIFVSVLTLVVSFCSIVYELLYSQALTVLYGETVARYSVTIGLYLLSLGLGAFFYNSMGVKNNYNFFWWNEIALSIVGPLGVLALFFLGSFNFATGFPGRGAALFLSHVPIVLVGVLSGFELPLLVHLLTEGEKDRFSKILGLDYVGSFLGTVVYSLFLYPRSGLIVTAFAVGFLNFVATAVYCHSDFFKNRVRKLITLFLLFIYFILLFFSNGVQTWIQNDYRRNEILNIFSGHARADQGPVQDVLIERSFSTAYQDVTLYTVKYAGGNSDFCMNLDSNVQTCDSWVRLYHHGLVDVPMRFLPDKKVNALVVGGGDWIAIRYLLRHPNVASIDHVDIDQKFCDYMKQHPYFEKFHERSYEDARVHTVIDDAFNYLRFNEKRYDLILVDIPGITHDKLSHLYSAEFYAFVNRALSEKGMAVLWDYRAGPRFRAHYKVLMNTLREAGFRYHMLYDTLDLDKKGNSSQPFYIVSRVASRNAPGLDEGPLLAWIEIPFFSDTRSNTVLRPNYDIVLHR